MRATEISEAGKINLPEIAQSAHGVWYEIDPSTATKWHKTHYADYVTRDTPPAARYFMFVKNGGTLTSLHNRLVLLHNGQMENMQGSFSFVGKSDRDNLTALVKATNAQTGERVWGDFIVYKGNVYDADEFPATMPVVGQISTGSVYEIPLDLVWALNKIHLKYQVSAHRVVMFKTTQKNFGDAWGAASIKDGKISDIKSQRPLDKVTQVKLGKELSQALGLAQKVTVLTHIIPESKLHDTLRAISDNPGKYRWDLYMGILKLRSVPARGSKDDATTELVNLGLVKDDESDQSVHKGLTITPIGKLVLARVNSGKSVAKASLIKQ